MQPKEGMEGAEAETIVRPAAAAAPALVHLAVLLLRAFAIVLLVLPFVLLALFLMR